MAAVGPICDISANSGTQAGQSILVYNWWSRCAPLSTLMTPRGLMSLSLNSLAENHPALMASGYLLGGKRQFRPASPRLHPRAQSKLDLESPTLYQVADHYPKTSISRRMWSRVGASVPQKHHQRESGTSRDPVDPPAHVKPEE